METINVNLLTRIYQNAKCGTISIEETIDKIKEPALKELLSNQQATYDVIISECAMISKDVKDNNFFKKIKQTAMIGLSTLTDKSPRNISQMMIQNTTSGMIDTIKALYDYGCADENILKLGKKLQSVQEKFIDDLKLYLK